MTPWPRLVLACLWSASAAIAAQRGESLVRNGGFEAGEAGWNACGKGFAIDQQEAHTGRRSLRCSSAAMDETRGARQVITLDPPVKHPFRVSGWSKAGNAEVARDYDVYLDLHYADGTPLWGQIARFQPGTHGWQQAVFDFAVAKPVKTIEVHVLFRRAKGTVWFDDIAVELLPFEFRELRVLPNLYGKASAGVVGTATLPCRWTATLDAPLGRLAEASGQALPIRLHWARGVRLKDERTVYPCELRVSATDMLLGETIEATRSFKVDADDAGPSRGYAVWTDTSMHRVLPHALPATAPREPTARIALAANEREALQIVLLALPGQELRGVRVEVTDLVSRKASARIAAEHVTWHQVGYVKLEGLWPHPAYREAAAGWWPDPLLPVETVDVPKGFAQPIWVTVSAPPGTPPGDYEGTVTVSPQGREPTAVQVRATVYGFQLPVRGHLKTAFALMDGFLEKVHGKPLRAALRQQYGDLVLEHRLNPDDISRTSPPAIEDLLHYRGRGLNAFNVLNMVQERGDRAWVCWSPKEAYTPALKQRLIERLDPYVEQLRRHKLTGRAYIYTFDERGDDFFPIIREYFGMVKQRYPEIHTLTTAKVPQDPAVMRDLNVDWNCPVSSAYHFEQAERCRAAGLEVWSYICLGPRYPFANWLADDPLIEARVIWWQAFEQKMDGFLYWGLNIWGRQHNDRPIDPAAGPLLRWGITTGGTRWTRLHGDGVLLYPGTSGPIGSIRLANIRDGLEDYEYLWLLAEKLGDRDAAREACLPVARSLTSFTRDPAALRAQRERIARQIEGH